MTASRIRVAVLVGVIACLPSCMTLKVIGSRTIDKTPDAVHVTEFVHGSYWGFMWDEPQVTKIRKDHQLIRIDYHDNVLYLLASVVTVGLYVPQSVEWWSDMASVDEGGNSLRPSPGR